MVSDSGAGHPDPHPTINDTIPFTSLSTSCGHNCGWRTLKGTESQVEEAENMWTAVSLSLRAQVSDAVWYSTFNDVQALGVTEDTLRLAVPSGTVRDKILSRYYPIVLDAMAEAGAGSRNLVVEIVAPETAVIDVTPTSAARPAETPVAKTSESDTTSVADRAGLNPRYTFETFVRGASNSFALAAAQRVAETPARSYNPLFIYGGVGLGKTHLMHAIGQSILSRKPDAKVLYLSSERFTNDLINSIREDKMEEFRNRYRSIDLLLIDDIQFIEKKERTQEEFFHTFNALHEAGKQIVISSDRPPKDMAELEARLRSRFEWGLVTDISTPDLETRIAILQKKADLDALKVPDDVLEYIANQYQNNVRELEGAFIRVMAYASLTGSAVTVALAQQTLGIHLLKEITLDAIKQLMSEHYRIDMAELIGNGRQREISWARQVGMYIARELTSSSLPKVGDAFGGRDHTTVMHAHDKIKKAVAANPEVDREVKALMQRLR